MKFYETTFDEYLEAVNKYNLHPELLPKIAQFPSNISDICNQIVYGPPGSGKYSQVLKILEKYSPTHLKYSKKMTVQTEKQKYVYHISDIHYEIDMSLLGCNSKIIWHEVYLQIVDIVSMCHLKQGIIVCKNFHSVHNELLDIFYSYIQQYNHSQISIKINFIILTEHISFIPNNILNNCNIISIAKPDSTRLAKIFENKSSITKSDMESISNVISTLDNNTVINIKELASFSLIPSVNKIPFDIFNTICNTIIKEMNNYTKISIPAFRDMIYDILVYNLDVNECIWYILSHFIREPCVNNMNITSSIITEMTTQTFIFFKNFNNNYRPIYHLESILFYFIIKIYSNTNGQTASDGNLGTR